MSGFRVVGRISFGGWSRLNSVAALGLALTLSAGMVSPARSQMVNGSKIVGQGKAFGLDDAHRSKTFVVEQVSNTVPANILWPDEKAELTFRFRNLTPQPIQAKGSIEIIRYGTRTTTNFWEPIAFSIADEGTVPITVSLPANGETTVTVAPPIPETFGGYLLIANLDGQGRTFAASLARVPTPEPGRERLPTGSLDMFYPWEINDKTLAAFKRLGIKAARMEIGYFPTTSPDYERKLADWRRIFKLLSDANITVMLTVENDGAPQPLDHFRPYLASDGTMLDAKDDRAWLPSSDPDFQLWCKRIASEFGWPNGPVNAFELWNEPWEGVSISGWGADLPRFREMYARMAAGVHEARRDAKVQVLVGGACSSSNTLDKLFPDGKDTFLPDLDFVSIHYQPMSALPSLVPSWVNRKIGTGPVQVWDTESWVANSEDRIAAVVASMRAQGQARTNGVYRENVVEYYQPKVDGQTVSVLQAWSPAAGVAAAQKFLGQRPFQQILFKNGLPWVFVFKGLNEAVEEGTVVVVGDLGGVYDRNKLLFRTVHGLKNRGEFVRLRNQSAGLTPDAPEDKRRELEAEQQLAEVLDGGSMTLPNPAGEFQLLDFYGNSVAVENGKIVVPLNGLGYFLRTNGAQGSFARLLNAIRTARIGGYEPLEMIPHDLTAPVTQHPILRVRVTNVLNRRVSGQLIVGNLIGTAGAGTFINLDPPNPHIALAPNETKILSFRVKDGKPSLDNAYQFSAAFNDDSPNNRYGNDALHLETIHVNQIARRRISVDGKLDDWRGVLPQTVSPTQGIGTSLSEQAYLPFRNFEAGVNAGLASGFLAYDNDYFYFAAKIADSTPYDGNVRFATRNDDQYYYPDKAVYVERDRNSGAITKREELTWPAGIRHYSYRKDPDLPSGNGTDNVQIAFNALPASRKAWYDAPPGTMPRFMAYPDTDYEFALNQVAKKYGGGTEIWRLYAPGTPRKHFYPRQPKAAIDGGPVTKGKLAMRRDGNTRIVECALPWSEIPEVRKRLDTGQTVKFSFRVNDNKGPAYELAAGRGVSRDNFPCLPQRLGDALGE